MELLIDTCAFIWWDSGGGHLPQAANSALCDPANELHLSHASIWEMQLKHQKEKLQLRKDLAEIIDEQRVVNGLRLLPIEPGDIYSLSQLPFHHSDPFDRLIIAQALQRGFTIITDDRLIPKYGVPVLW
jgi:PIN domain nuclease of toxin-antitoxin system